MLWKKAALFLLCSVIAFGGAARAAADVLFLRDGTILIGSLVDAQGSQLTYESFGTRRVLSSSEIVRTEKEISALGDRSYDIALLDGTVFTGKIADYDPEIGIFIDLSIGSLTLPSAGIKEIVDRPQRELWEGSALALSVSGHYFWPISNDFFAPSMSAGLAVDAKLPWRGLVAGLSLEWSLLKYETDEDVSYSMFAAVPRIGYRYLGWKTSKGFLSAFTPFAFLGAGPVYVAASDSRLEDEERSGELSLLASMEIGIDVGITKGFALRISGKPQVVFQSEKSFLSIGAGAAAKWEIR